jgi:hypothetical protein
LAENSSGGMKSSAILKTQSTQKEPHTMKYIFTDVFYNILYEIIPVPDLYQSPVFMRGLRGCLWDNGTLSLECEVSLSLIKPHFPIYL